MPKVIPIRINDWDFVLSDLDRHQIENVVWISATPYKKLVKSITCEVVEFYQHDLGDGFRMACSTELVSGILLKTEVLGAHKRNLIVSFGKQLRTDLQERLVYESGVVFRTLRWIREKLTINRRASNRRSQGSSRHCLN